MLSEKLCSRLRQSWPVAGLHLLVSAVVAFSCAYLVFFIWFPGAFSMFAGGAFLLFIIVFVDVLSGPLITLLSYTPKKEKWKWHLDITLIGLFQVSALIYGISVLHQARPVKVAFEGDQFRLVLSGDIAKGSITNAAKGLDVRLMQGPQVIGVSLLGSAEDGFKDSVMMSLAGHHPAFRPDRWAPYKDYKESVIESATPLEKLNVELQKKLTDGADGSLGSLGIVPFEVGLSDRWSVLVDMNTAEILNYLDIDIWKLED